MNTKYGSLYIASRKQRLMSIKVIIAYLERIRDAEQRIATASCDAELVASIIDEAVLILETIQ